MFGNAIERGYVVLPPGHDALGAALGAMYMNDPLYISYFYLGFNKFE